MSKDRSRMVWGGLLIVAGILFLLQEFQVLGSALDYLWVVLMGVGAGVFLWIYFSKRDQPWSVIPGLTLLGLALVSLDDLIPGMPSGNWNGTVFLGCLGMAFWLLYLRRKDQWWAIIPGGVLVTLALVDGVEFLTDWTDGIFFIGMGVTFALVAALPNQTHDTRWAYIPAAALILLGFILFAPFKNVVNYIWPALLVGLGVFILVRSWK